MYQDVKDRLYRGHRKIANNTYLTDDRNGMRPDQESVSMRLHGNLIARFYPDHLELHSTGWYTTTTKDRLNLALEIAGVNKLWFTTGIYKRIYQVDYQWYYGNYHKGDTKFTDGMCINYRGKVIGGK